MLVLLFPTRINIIWWKWVSVPPFPPPPLLVSSPLSSSCSQLLSHLVEKPEKHIRGSAEGRKQSPVAYRSDFMPEQGEGGRISCVDSSCSCRLVWEKRGAKVQPQQKVRSSLWKTAWNIFCLFLQGFILCM